MAGNPDVRPWARAQTGAPLDWADFRAPEPSFLGTRTFHAYDLAELREFIDWTPFFRTWELAGKYPDILEDDVVGESARELFADAQKCSTR